jgi:hypothetical protein
LGFFILLFHQEVEHQLFEEIQFDKRGPGSREHGGTLEVEQKDGEGATFVITLPT